MVNNNNNNDNIKIKDFIYSYQRITKIMNLLLSSYLSDYASFFAFFVNRNHLGEITIFALHSTVRHEVKTR